jgi:hypothetical protein
MDNDGRVYNLRVDIGADEVDCGDVSNPLDWDADGLVNLKEFSKFQWAWLSRDPNEYTDPNFIDPNEIANWNPVCNLNTTGDSQYIIDLADLEIFWSDTPWLWQACWKDDGLYETMGMSGGGESIMSMPMMETMSFETVAIEQAEEVNPYAAMSTAEVVSLVVGIHDIIGILETAIEEDHENAENLTEAKEFLEDVLADIEAAR